MMGEILAELLIVYQRYKLNISIVFGVFAILAVTWITILIVRIARDFDSFVSFYQAKLFTYNVIISCFLLITLLSIDYIRYNIIVKSNREVDFRSSIYRNCEDAQVELYNSYGEIYLEYIREDFPAYIDIVEDRIFGDNE